MTLSAHAWLAQADPDPEHANRWLSQARVVLLPLGRAWDAVKVLAPLGIEAARSVCGPVIYDPAGHAVFFLVPAGTAKTWELADTMPLGEACYLTTPAPEVTAPPGPHWLHVPDGRSLVDPHQLREALAAVGAKRVG